MAALAFFYVSTREKFYRARMPDAAPRTAAPAPAHDTAHSAQRTPVVRNACGLAWVAVSCADRNVCDILLAVAQHRGGLVAVIRFPCRMAELEPAPESQPTETECSVAGSCDQQDWAQHMPEWAEIDESEVFFGDAQHCLALKLYVVRPAAILAECNHASKAGGGAVNATDTTGLAAWGLAT
eukprot:COSAG02_NODE_16638_length_1068_cov_0.985552_1_plen_181_part_10